MKPSIFAAFALVFTAGYAEADNRSFAGAALFHDVVQMTCGFNMTPESAKKAAATLGMSNSPTNPMLLAISAVCKEVKKGNRGKVIEIQVPDDRKVIEKSSLKKRRGTLVRGCSFSRRSCVVPLVKNIDAPL
jgi:hypothetical protein